MVDRSEWLNFFNTVHTSKGVFKQPSFPIDNFLETGERKFVKPKPKPKPTPPPPPIVSAPTVKPPPKTPIAPPPPSRQAPGSTIMIKKSNIILPPSTILDETKNDSVSENVTSIEPAASENITSIAPPSETETINDDIDDGICNKEKDSDFTEKLNEAVEAFKQGLPAGNKLRMAINYAVNIIKPAEGKEELWFDAIEYDEEDQLNLKLTDIPKKVKYLKEGSIIKPTLDKIDKFFISENS